MLLQKFKSIRFRLHWDRLFIYYGFTIFDLIITVCAGIYMIQKDWWYLLYFGLPIGFGIIAYFIFTRWLRYLRIFFVSVIFLGFFSLLLLLDSWRSVFTIGFCVLDIIALCFQYFDRKQYASKQRDLSIKEQEFTSKSNLPDSPS